MINSVDYIPQTRERLFIIASKVKHINLITPQEQHNTVLKDYLDLTVDKFYSKERLTELYNRWDRTSEFIGKGKNTLYIPNRPNKNGGFNTYWRDDRVMGTITTGNNMKVVYTDSIGELDEIKLRKLTPRESLRLMGWQDNQIDKVMHYPNSKLYYTAGNSMVIQVMEAILKEIL